MGTGGKIKRGFRNVANLLSGGACDRRDAKKMIKETSRNFDNAVEEFRQAQEDLIRELEQYQEIKKSAYNNQLSRAAAHLSSFRKITIKQRTQIQLPRKQLPAESKYGNIEGQLQLRADALESVVFSILGFMPILNIGAWLEAKEHLDNTTLEVAKINKEIEGIRLMSSNFKQGQEIVFLAEKTVGKLLILLEDLISKAENLYKRIYALGRISVIIYKVLPPFFLKRKLSSEDEELLISLMNITVTIAEIFKQVNIIKEDNTLDLTSRQLIETSAEAHGITLLSESDKKSPHIFGNVFSRSRSLPSFLSRSK